MKTLIVKEMKSIRGFKQENIVKFLFLKKITLVAKKKDIQKS